MIDMSGVARLVAWHSVNLVSRFVYLIEYVENLCPW